ncbi:MAG: metal ABC transporter permease, partial [Myxococcota bacterium]
LGTAVRDAHIDTHCLLFGDVLGITDETLRTLTVVALMIAGLVAMFWRWLAVSTLDPDFAATVGIPATAVHYGLMSAVAATTMASFEAVGAILVIAMIIVPAATAHLLTDRLGAMALVALSHGVLSAWLGMYASVWLDCSTAGAMVVCGGTLYTLALVFAPRHGLLARAGRLNPAEVM